MSNRAISVILILSFLFLILLTGCTPTYIDSKENTTKTITVNIQFVTEEKVLYNNKISIKSDNPLLFMATYQALLDSKMSYSEIGGIYGNFSGYPDTEDEMWNCTVNGEMVSETQRTKSLTDSDKIVWKYEKS